MIVNYKYTLTVLDRCSTLGVSLNIQNSKQQCSHKTLLFNKKILQINITAHGNIHTYIPEVKPIYQK